MLFGKVINKYYLKYNLLNILDYIETFLFHFYFQYFCFVLYLYFELNMNKLEN